MLEVDICFNENNKSLKTSVELSLILKNVRFKFKIWSNFKCKKMHDVMKLSFRLW